MGVLVWVLALPLISVSFVAKLARDERLDDAYTLNAWGAPRRLRSHAPHSATTVRPLATR